MSSHNEQDSAPIGSLSDLLRPVPGDLLEPRPFQGEEEYWTLTAHRFEARHQLHELRQRLTEYAGFTRAGHPVLSRQPYDGTLLREAHGALKDEEARLMEAFRQRWQLTDPVYPAPRLLRFAAHADLEDVELDVLHYLILATCDPCLGEWLEHKLDTGDIASFLGLDAAAFFRLLESDRPLLRLGVISVERQVLASPRTRDFKIDLATVKALRGLSLSEEDSYALGDNTILEVLEEEPGARKTRTEGEPASGDTTAKEHSTDEEFREDALDNPADFDIDSIFRDQDAPAPPAEESGLIEAVRDDAPYRSDLEYLNDHLEWLRHRYKWKQIKLKGDDFLSLSSDESPDILVRQGQMKEKLAKSRIEQRLQLTCEADGWLPRAERLARTRHLGPFEKHVLLFLTGYSASLEFREALDTALTPEVGGLLHLFFDTLEEQIAGRRYFSPGARLVSDGFVRVESYRFGQDILNADVEMDRRMVEYLLGLDTDSSSLVEGSHLYSSRVDLDRVVIPAAEKELVVQTVEQFPAFQEERRRSGLNDIISYGGGLVLLFYGPSGTGKTMLANALAHRMRKRILLVNFPTIGGMTSDDALKFLFREAKVHDAILFFDECEGVFESRENHNPGISLILTEIERHDGLVIMATNRAFELDEAMHRRITLAIEFRVPDSTQREAIWRAHIPPQMRLTQEPDFAALAYRYELTGGLIKNAVLAALALATSRDPRQPTLRPDDFEHGARLQMRGRFRMTEFEDRVVPRHGLDKVVVTDSLRRSLKDLIGLEKARRTLVGQWGFASEAERGMGTTALFHGPPGTGKTLTAEAIGYELGRPVKRVNAAQVVSKWVGEGAKNLETVFKDARDNDAVLVFDEADTLFAGRTSVSSSTDRYANLDVAVLLREMERFSGVAILTTNLADTIDDAFQRRLALVLEFPRPDVEAREALWRRHIPEQTPLADDVDLDTLARDVPLTGGQIRNAVIKAAARATLRPAGERRVTHDDLRAAAEGEAGAGNNNRVVGFLNGYTR